MRRVADQLSASPLAVYDAPWQLLYWNSLFAATWGPLPGRRRGPERHDHPVRTAECPVRQTAAERAWFEQSLVADLRTTTGRYPNDPDVASLTERLNRTPRSVPVSTSDGGRLWPSRARWSHRVAEGAPAGRAAPRRERRRARRR
ncbi:MmyB family transcriptional regulator [Saccharothrix sp. HUAS TT10]|uniref:MmyB family transcriptional regulator n=1 Tax=Saccharothrix sp. HUAS TT10 TaxID=3447450 RepID=UPI003F70A089